MNTQIIKSRDKHLWDEYVQNSPKTIAWHTYDWHRVVQEHYRTNFLPIGVYRGGSLTGILPLYAIKSPFQPKKLISIPYFVAGGIVADDGESELMLLDKAISLAADLQCSEIILKQYKHSVAGELRTDDSFYNKELDLTQDPKAIWNGYLDINRHGIEDAAGEHPHLDYPFADVDAFFTLLVRHNYNMGTPCVSKAWIRSLFDSGIYSIAVLRVNDTIVAGTMIKAFKKTVSFPFTSLRENNEKHNAYAYYMYHELIRYFASQQMEIFHSGRIPQNNTTMDYRLGWGGVPHTYYHQYYPKTVRKTEISVKRGRKRELLSFLWKNLPSRVSAGLGPYVVRHFP